MSGVPLTRAQHRLNAQSASAAAAIAQAAAAAGAIPQLAPLGVGGGNAGDAAIQMLAQLLQQQSLQAKADQAERVAARFEAALAAAEALAQQRRAGAGPPPLFRGQARDIAVHTWLIALERWFENAHIDAVGADSERIEIASSALREAAQTWCAAALAADAADTAAGAPPSLNTWAAFAAAARKHFLPQDVERWARQQLDTLAGSGTRDVAAYTTKFVEYDMLLSAPARADQIGRVMAYERGLPESYRVKCAERQHTTLGAAMESTLALWNARSAAQAQSSRPPARLSNAEDGALGEEPQGEPSAASNSDQRMRRLEDGIATLTAMFQERGGNHYGRGGGRGGRSGRTGNREQPGTQGRARSRSDSRPRTPGISEELAKQRLACNVCIKCAEPGHYARDCKNEVKSN